jgi:hypothetical protein
MKRIIGISFIILTVTLFSCHSDKVELPVDDLMTEKSAQITLTEVQLEAAATETEYEVEFYANAEEMLTRWWKMGKMWRWNNKLRYQMNHCPNVEIVNGENDGYPKTITLSYGDSTVLKNGKVLSGEIVIDISAPRRSKDYTRLVAYSNFGVDSLTIDGTSSVTVDKAEDTFRNHISILTLKKEGAFEITRTAERNWTWVEGLETVEDQNDDVIYIEGSVVAENGTDSYEKKIIEPLVKRKDCRFIVAGIVEIYLNGSLISTMDYGDGTCDEVATMITTEGEVEIDLAQHKMKGKQNQHQNSNQNGNG